MASPRLPWINGASGYAGRPRPAKTSVAGRGPVNEPGRWRPVSWRLSPPAASRMVRAGNGSSGIRSEKMILQSGLLRWAAVALAGLGLIIVVINIVFNQKLQDEVASRQQMISDRVEYQRVGEAMVRSISTIAATSRDAQLVAMMVKYGMPTPSAAPPALTPPAGRGR